MALSSSRMLLSTSVKNCAPNFWRHLSRKSDGLGPAVDYTQFEAFRKDDKKAVIIDVRQPKELVEMGEIPETINIPMGHLEEAFKLDEKSFYDIYRVKKPSKEDPLVFFCLKGIRAKTSQEFVESQYKYENTYFYPGSFADWVECQKK